MQLYRYLVRYASRCRSDRCGKLHSGVERGNGQDRKRGNGNQSGHYAASPKSHPRIHRVRSGLRAGIGTPIHSRQCRRGIPDHEPSRSRSQIIEQRHRLGNGSSLSVHGRIDCIYTRGDSTNQRTNRSQSQGTPRHIGGEWIQRVVFRALETGRSTGRVVSGSIRRRISSVLHPFQRTDPRQVPQSTNPSTPGKSRYGTRHCGRIGRNGQRQQYASLATRHSKHGQDCLSQYRRTRSGRIYCSAHGRLSRLQCSTHPERGCHRPHSHGPKTSRTQTRLLPEPGTQSALHRRGRGKSQYHLVAGRML
mmetsp:Transcript_13781/g.28931  ORF Transcript_13781/g.28931 Transcript_13781/m.28931 type:complete len:306 (-) Transcript_13781:1308-2225(-)